VDISRELLEKEVVSRFVPRVIQRIAGSGAALRWLRNGREGLSRLPVQSSAPGLNYYFVRAWGERARSHFRQTAYGNARADEPGFRQSAGG